MSSTSNIIAVTIGQQGPAGPPGDLVPSFATKSATVAGSGSGQLTFTAAEMDVESGGMIELRITGPGGAYVVRSTITAAAGVISAISGEAEAIVAPTSWSATFAADSGNLVVTLANASGSPVTIRGYLTNTLPS